MCVCIWPIMSKALYEVQSIQWKTEHDPSLPRASNLEHAFSMGQNP